ncbi:HAD superfamily hydrolase (TIGR01509 family) [Melghirimyces profundicolus]|uniref:HAD superfamily hydrolase (TIGR01509 family) n=1 Tax=Melghirimyces profundicolus TaxID=1242148 RepID=A0A2T6C7P6_9BACL|nr:HAD family hydrolase [Melghirimyces profundicolus]PTX64349.1 HAD superfamily hydrolase (TIGR01509 family) [Melghirimyces profundicolus]
MIRAVIFDFDGLILDTETSEYRTFAEIYEQYGAQLPMESWARVVGSSDSDFDPYDYLEKHVGRPLDRGDLESRRRERHLAYIEEEDILPGVREVLEQARELGWKVGLASSSTRSWVEGYLNKLGIRPHFQCLRTRDDVERTKPDPALYRLAAECLGVDPSEAVALEDSPNGALAAKRAGMRCIAVPNSVTKHFAFGDIDLRLDSLEELDLKAWADRVEKTATGK